ncbi:hypothetical protein CS053_00495 [Rhodanobacter glycinis]|uniref:Lipoprotein-attachment site-containing protein n=1 Tax=Rhodanobacter glycinis TaxID=582702 RepID=A0A5B9DUD5_9GAMM|nr:lipoprotein [Rhodanobacter glycinis]QEE23143.1 hypothetical protein CS053_00495 [Rhodanobacter glycinis]
MRRSILLLPFCLAAVALAGCGNKGPLYLPKPVAPTAAAPVIAPAASTSAPAHAASVTTTPADH